MDGGIQELDHSSSDDQGGVRGCDLGLSGTAQVNACHKQFL